MVLPDFLTKLLNERGFVSDVEKDVFLSPDFNRGTHSTFLLADVRRAAERILMAHTHHESIAIYADFDADGIPGAVVLHDLFKKLGITPLVHIPHRHNEGYGLHPAAVDTLHAQGVTLIISVDVGISGHAGALRAKERGIDLIITDHHELPAELPVACAIVHPRLICAETKEPYPFPHLCGAAVAFKLVQAVLAVGREQEHASCIAIPEGWEKWLLDMVGIATLSDMVPLVGENRVLAHYGLTVLRKSPRKGLRALCKKNRIDQSTITEEDIGFTITPRINAASRMDEPELAFRLLATADADEADMLAATLEKLNTKRKGAVASVVKIARAKVQERHPHDFVAVVGDPSWKPSLLGLAANSLLEGRAGVVCLWGRDGTGVLKGSCRSDGSVHVTEMFAAAGVALEESGGHACAGGFSVSHDAVHTLHTHFSRVARTIPAAPVMAAAHAIHPKELTYTLYESLRVLAPFGVGNEKPQLELPDVLIEEVRIFGKEGNHTEILVSKDGYRIRAFQFFKTPDEFTRPPAVGEYCTLIGSVERDQFKGFRKVALRTVDVR
ncbi:MAG: single-stranded-DNA-specific exonuclease RecJ [Candidatus Pacebacteria bacterium]|nr:single-stranded-DNA-specific exonuclease RecJ [Candidatus Paceibacterota bacterium]